MGVGSCESSKPAMPAGTMALEVTVLSCEDVVLPNSVARRALRGAVYAVVTTASSSASTGYDEDTDCNGEPYWGEALRVAMPPWAPGLDVEICRRLPGGKVETVAAAHVPAADFTAVGPPGHLHCLSYRLHDGERGANKAASCQRNGIVNITVKRTDVEYVAPVFGKKAMNDAGASGSGGSCFGVAGDGKPAAPVAPAGSVVGYPVGFTANGKACV